MKNPETESISGFCCKLHFHLSSRRQAWFGHLKIKIPGFAGGPIWAAEKEGMKPHFQYLDNDLFTGS